MTKLRETKDFDAAAFRLFGYKPKQPGDHLRPYTANQFHKALGIKITDYKGFYAETDGVDAPVGPLTPATSRLQIHPILAIRRTHRGHHQVYGLSYGDGFFNRDKTKAWIKTDDYMALVNDDYYERLAEEMDRISQGKADLDGKKLKRVKVENPDTIGLREKEKAIYKKVNQQKSS